MTFTVIVMIFMVRFLRLPSVSLAALASCFVALAAIVRPSAYALIPALALMVIFRWKAIQGRRVVLVAAAILPALILCAIERIGTQTYHGAAATSIAGPNIYAKAAMIDAPPALPSQDPRKIALQNALQTDFAPIRQILNGVPRWDVRESISDSYEECVEYRCSQEIKASLNIPEPEVNRLALAVGLDRIARAPLAFAALVWERYRSLWTIYQLSFPPAVPVFKSFVAEHSPLPFQDQAAVFTENPQPSLLALFVRPGMLAVGGLTFLMAAFGLIAALRRNLDARIAGASLIALTLHGSLIFTALTAVGLRRFTFGMWPVIMVALMLFAGWTLDLAIKQASPRNRPDITPKNPCNRGTTHT